MLELAIVLIGIWAVASMVLPVIAIVKLIMQQKQIAWLQNEITWLTQQVQKLQHNLSEQSDIKKTQPNFPLSALDMAQDSLPSMTVDKHFGPQSAFIQPHFHPINKQNIQSNHLFFPTKLEFSSVYLQNDIFSTHYQVVNGAKNFNQDKVSVPMKVSVDESAPDIVTSLFASFKQWLFGENFIVRIGAIVLLVGIVLLLKLASQYIHVSIAIRMIMIAISGLVITGIGYKTSFRRRGYGLTLQGIGFAMIYLTVFSSFYL